VDLIRIAVWLLHADKFMCQIGLNNLVIRETNYKGRITHSNYYILANNKFPIESEATARYQRDETYLGLCRLAARSVDCVDVGANIGTHSLLLSQYCSGITFAFEPSLDIFSRLKKNIMANNLESKVLAFQLGISDKPQRLLYSSTNKNPGNGHLYKERNQLNFNDPAHLSDFHSEVMCDSLDNIVVELSDLISIIDLIKIDIESMEYLAILGMMQTITKFMPALLIETTSTNSDVRGYDCITPIFQTLYSLGYESFTFKKGQFQKFIYPNFTNDTFFLTQKHFTRLSEKD